MNLPELIELFSKTVHPEDLFGDGIKTEEELQKAYKKFLVQIHEDRFKAKSEKEKARNGSQILASLLQKGLEKLKFGTYGQRHALNIVISSPLAAYVVHEKIADGDISRIYQGKTRDTGIPVLIKVCRNPKNNDLVKNEASILKHIWSNEEAKKMPTLQHHIPQLLDSFQLKDGSFRKMVNVLSFSPGFYTLEEVKNQHGRLDPRDLSWMLNRMLAALATAHAASVCHGALVPSHFLINPEDHNGVLIDWSYATLNKSPIKAIVPRYKYLYPPEVLTKGNTGNSVDNYMFGKIGLLLCAFDKEGSSRMRSFFETCTYAVSGMRPDNTWELFEDFGRIQKQLFGKPKFRQFTMQRNK